VDLARHRVVDDPLLGEHHRVRAVDREVGLEDRRVGGEARQELGRGRR